MALGNLSVESAVGISTAWVDPEKDRPALESVPLLVPLMAEIDSSHHDLIRIQITNSANIGELRKLTDLAQDLDGRNDRIIHGLFDVLTGLHYLADDPAEAALVLGLRDELLPDGLKATQRSYLDEAGNVSLVEGRLTSATRDRLTAIPLPHGTLADAVDKWIGIGKQLGDVERRRVQLSKEKDEETVGGAEVNRARRRWVQVAETMIQLLDLMPALDEETKTRILQPLRTAEAKADRQRQSAREKNAAAEEAGPTPAEEPA